MLNDKRFFALLLLYFVCLLIPAYWFPLLETTSARYAEISREMLASGNWMEPYYNGIKHFHKPPFTYWINALGISIFGVNGFAVRFFGVVAAVITLIYTRRTAYILTNDREIANVSVMILASSSLFLIVSRVVSTDIYITMFTIMTVYYMFCQIYGERTYKNALAIGVLTGLGFMTKGPVIIIFTLLPYLTALIWDKSHRSAFTFFNWGTILSIFFLIAIPWYWHVVQINGGLLDYFLGDQVVARVSSDKFNRSKPFYFFFAVFFLTFLPWIFFVFRNKSYINKLKTNWVLYLYILMPFIVFQMATSKLGTYLLPFYPIAAIIAALNTDSKFLRKLSYALLFVLSFAMFVIPFVLDYMWEYKFLIFSVGVLFVLITLFYYRKFSHNNFVISFSSIIVIMFTVVYLIAQVAGPYSKGYRLVAEDIKRFDPSGEHSVLVYAAFAPSVSFYLDKIVPIAFGRDRETQFQEKGEYKHALISTNQELVEYLADKKELIVVTLKEKSYRNFEKNTGYSCSVISVRGDKKYTVHCKSPLLSN